MATSLDPRHLFKIHKGVRHEASKDIYLLMRYPFEIYLGAKILLGALENSNSDHHLHIPFSKTGAYDLSTQVPEEIIKPLIKDGLNSESEQSVKNQVIKFFNLALNLGLDELALSYHNRCFKDEHGDFLDGTSQLYDKVLKQILPEKEGHLEFKVNNETLKLFRGQEIDVSDDKATGHFLVVKYQSPMNSLNKYSLEDIVKVTHDHEGRVISAHPLAVDGICESCYSLKDIGDNFKKLADLGVDAYELTLRVPGMFNIIENSLVAYVVNELNQSGYNLKLYVNSDAHDLKHMKNLYGTTKVNVEKFLADMNSYVG